MKLFDKLFGSVGKALSEDAEKPKEKQKEQVETSAAKPTLESKEDLLLNVLKTVSKFYYDESETSGKNIVIWLDTDQLTFDDYEKYRKRILHALVNDRGYKFEDVTMKIGAPGEALRCTSIHPNGKEFIQILDTTYGNITRKAAISIQANRGSLLQEQYILSSDDMRKQGIQCNNIGCGENPVMSTGYRHNHIAIDDNPDSPMIELNKFVSRAHAHIGYSDKFGFYLQVEMGGTHQAGKRTRIFRGDKVIEIDNIGVKEPLINGDLIELGKSVCLKFVELTN